MDYTSSEHINPFDTSNPDFWMKIEHLGRYLYAVKMLEKHAKANSGKPLNHLDVGCAQGYGLKILTEATEKLTGVDYNKDALQEAQKTCPDAVLIHMDMDKTSLTEFKSKPFTTLTAFEVLEHLEDPHASAKDMAEVTKKGGLVLASFPNPSYERLDETGHPENPFHHHAQSLEESTKMFEDAGFIVQKVLGQPLCNILFSRERNLHNDGVLKNKPFAEPHMNTPQNITAMANLLAWPQEDKLEKSYTFIFELIRE